MNIIDELDSSVKSDFDYGKPAAAPSAEILSSLKSALELQLVPLRRRRGVFKRKITLLLKQLPPEGDGSPEAFLRIRNVFEKVAGTMSDILAQDESIESTLSLSDYIVNDQTPLNEEIIASANYHLKLKQALHVLRSKYNLTQDEPPRSRASSGSLETEVSENRTPRFNPPKDQPNASFKKQCPLDLRIPALKCPSFSGESDKYGFRSFLQSYNNVYGDRRDLTDAAKQIGRAHV